MKGVSMTENDANIYLIAYRDCKEVSDGIDCNEDFGKANTILFYMDEILEALKTAGELQAIGTVEGYELAINESIDKHNLMVVYKDRLKEFETIGTIEEFKALKEKEERFDRNIRMFNEIGLEIRAKVIDEFAEKIQWEYLNSCGLKQREIDFLVAVSSMVAEQMKAGGIDG